MAVCGGRQRAYGFRTVNRTGVRQRSCAGHQPARGDISGRNQSWRGKFRHRRAAAPDTPAQERVPALIAQGGCRSASFPTAGRPAGRPPPSADMENCLSNRSANSCSTPGGRGRCRLPYNGVCAGAQRISILATIQPPWFHPKRHLPKADRHEDPPQGQRDRLPPCGRYNS